MKNPFRRPGYFIYVRYVQITGEWEYGYGSKGVTISGSSRSGDLYNEYVAIKKAQEGFQKLYPDVTPPEVTVYRTDNDYVRGRLSK